ncbi:DUF1796 family putative cysteine peptidase [Muricoccus radiodurans]|uniref:DUF1796 family putative cysteine peptidase n=1 Tax=Muricoccus radiodurans TaxID=2231721 RepID=UPI003CF4FFBE
MEFRHVIPLGSRCRLTHNLRRHFGGDDKFPFDWFILTLSGLLRCLEVGMDPKPIYDPALLEPVLDAKGRLHSVRNTRFGILHHHDFPRTKDDLMGPEWRDHVPQAAARFGHLANRLRAAAMAGPVLFVRERHSEDDPNALGTLVEALRGLVPSGEVRLLAVNYNPARVPTGIETITVTEPEKVGWRGHPEAWDAALGGTGHRRMAA